MNAESKIFNFELTIERLILLIISVITMVVHVFFRKALTYPNISLVINIVFSAISLILFLLSYSSDFVRKYISWFLFSLIFIGTLPLLYFVFYPTFKLEMLLLLFVVILFSNLIFKYISQILIFNLFVIVALTYHFHQTPSEEFPIYPGALMGTLVLFFVAIFFHTLFKNKVLKELEMSEKQKDMILFNFPDIIIEVDNNHKIIYSNYDKIQTGEIGNFVAYITPEEQEKLSKLLARSFDVCFDHQISNKVTLEEHFTTIAGKVIEIRIIPYKMSHKIDRLIVHGKNITKMIEYESEKETTDKTIEQLEEKYRNVIESFKVGVFSTSNGIFTSVNSVMSDIFGFSERELIDKRAIELMKPELKDKVYKTIQNQGAKGIYKPIKAECVRKDGSIVKIQIVFNSFEPGILSHGIVIPL